MSGFILDAVGRAEQTGAAIESTVEGTLAAVRNSVWEKVQPVGDGDEYRVKSDDGAQASSLAFDDALVDGSPLTGA